MDPNSITQIWRFVPFYLNSVGYIIYLLGYHYNIHLVVYLIYNLCLSLVWRLPFRFIIQYFASSILWPLYYCYYRRSCYHCYFILARYLGLIRKLIILHLANIVNIDFAEGMVNKTSFFPFVNLWNNSNLLSEN